MLPRMLDAGIGDNFGSRKKAGDIALVHSRVGQSRREGGFISKKQGWFSLAFGHRVSQEKSELRACGTLLLRDEIPL